MPEPAAPVALPVVLTNQTTVDATNLANQFLAQMGAIQRGEQPQPLINSYPTSPSKTGPTGLAPLVNLGVAPGAIGNTGSVVQYGKPKEVDSVKLTAFPKPGVYFEK